MSTVRPVGAILRAVTLLPRLGWPVLAAMGLAGLGAWLGMQVDTPLARVGLAWTPWVREGAPLIARTLTGPFLMLLAFDRMAGRGPDVRAAGRRALAVYPLLFAVGVVLEAAPFALGLLNLEMLQAPASVIIASFATPLFMVILVERRAPGAAVRRTLELNRGSRWRLLFAFALYAVLYGVAMVAAVLAVSVPLMLSAADIDGVRLYAATNAVAFGVMSAVSAVLSAVLYRQMAEGRGGILASEVDEVFG